MDAHPAERTDMLAPIVVELTVPCPPGRAFEYFTRDIGRWWPFRGHSVGDEEAKDVAFEPSVGGRLFETERDGSTHTWGIVQTWSPADRVAFTWHPGRDEATAQWVEVTFAPHPEGTRVTLTHGGWEALGDGASAKRGRYAGGWQTVFSEGYGGYVRARESARGPGAPRNVSAR